MNILRLIPLARLIRLGFAALLGCLAPQTLLAQVIIIDPWPHPPHPPHPPIIMPPPPPREIPVFRPFEIRELTTDARVIDQVAEVRVAQRFFNPNSRAVEVEYLFPLPEGGTVQDFVLMVDGKELPGKILDKDEARRIYEEIVRRRRDPALLEYVGRGLLRTSVFPVPGRGERSVTLRYTQVLRRDGNVIEFTHPLATHQQGRRPVDRLRISVGVKSGEPIKSIYSPNHKFDLDREGDHEARLTYEERNAVPSGDFRLLITVEPGDVGASVLSYRPTKGEDGYFLLLAAPKVETTKTEPLPKTVVFVLDRSGSMSGKKIEQAREALRFVLNNLNDDDTFNIIAYDDRVESFRPELQRRDEETRAEALRFIDGIRAGGSTNIDAALRTAMAMLADESRPNYVIFLTDGLPTAGEKNEVRIAENCKEANKLRARLFAFGVGYDVNARLLDRLSGGNSGVTQFVRPEEDIEAGVAAFYSKMSSPVLAGLRLQLDGADVNRVYPRDLPDLFAGSQLVVAGRYADGGKTTIHLTGNVGDEERAFSFPAELAEPGDRPGHDFVERIWATRRIGFLIDQIDLHGREKELIDELVALSTRHGILTPYTSFLAEEDTALAAAPVHRERVYRSLGRLEDTTGAAGQSQRRMKAYFQSAKAVTPPSTQIAMEAAGIRADEREALGMTVAASGGRSPLRQVGAKTFYFKEGRWRDAEAIEPRAEPIRIELYSEEYFDWLRGLPPHQARYATFDEPYLLVLDGIFYQFDAPTR